MKTKKFYIQPEMKTVVMAMPSALLAGSGAGLLTPTDGPTGDDWGEN
jgi:hypothetical protein